MLCMTASRACAADAVFYYHMHLLNTEQTKQMYLCTCDIYCKLLRYQYNTHQGRPGKTRDKIFLKALENLCPLPGAAGCKKRCYGLTTYKEPSYTHLYVV